MPYAFIKTNETINRVKKSAPFIMSHSNTKLRVLTLTNKWLKATRGVHDGNIPPVWTPTVGSAYCMSAGVIWGPTGYIKFNTINKVSVFI